MEMRSFVIDVDEPGGQTLVSRRHAVGITFTEDAGTGRLRGPGGQCIHTTAGMQQSASWTFQLASCLIYARTLLEYVIFIVTVHSVNKMLPSVKFAEDKMLTFLIFRE